MKDVFSPLGLFMAGSGFAFYLLVASPLSKPDAFPLDDYLAAELFEPAEPLPIAHSPDPNPVHLVEEVLISSAESENAPFLPFLP